MKADICRVSKTVVLRFRRSRESNRVALKPIAPVKAYLYDHEQQNLYHVHLAHQWRGIPGNASIMKGFVFTQEPVGLRMMRLQQWGRIGISAAHISPLSPCISRYAQFH